MPDGMPYYNNYLSKIAQTPNIQYRSSTAAFVQSQWQDTTLLFTVQEETFVGSNVYNPVEVWKNTVSNFDTRIIKNEKDYRRLMFQNCEHQVGRGRMYQFDNNSWLVYEPTNEEEPYCDVLVRRCNNIAKWVDPDSGEIIEMPCVLEYDISSTNPKVNKDIIVANSSITMVIQGNTNTHALRRNARFIFNGIPYKFVAFNNYMQDDYITKDVPLLFMDLDFDVEKPTDDLVNNIADRYQYDFAVTINENPQQQVQGFSGKLTANVTLNGEDTDNVVSWSANEYATIDSSGNYVLVGDVGSTAVFTATFGSFFATVSINIVSNVVQTKEIVVDPLIAELNEQESVMLAANLYINGIKQSDAVTYTASGAASSCYTIVQNNNNFTITNVRRSSMPLQITFSSGVITRQISIKLNALF